MHQSEVQMCPTWRIATTVCALVGLYAMRTTGAPMSRAEILLPVNASNSACIETTQFVMYFPKSIKKGKSQIYQP